MEILIVILTAVVYGGTLAFMWVVARSLQRISKDLKRLADRIETKGISVDRDSLV
jgi:hypothetical protein